MFLKRLKKFFNRESEILRLRRVNKDLRRAIMEMEEYKEHMRN